MYSQTGRGDNDSQRDRSQEAGFIVHAARKQLGWSQERLAHEVGCAINTIKNYESYDVVPPRSKWAEKLEDVLSVKLPRDSTELDKLDPRVSAASDEVLETELARRRAERAAREALDRFGKAQAGTVTVNDDSAFNDADDQQPDEDPGSA